MPSLSCRIVFALLALFLVSTRTAGAEQPGDVVRVMSFNIRFGTAADGDNHWDKRSDLVLGTIRKFDPDVLGAQEVLAFQRDFLAEHLPQFEVVAAGRDDGQAAGEMAALFFNKNRFERIDDGHFWLSLQPKQPGSKSWDSSLPRIVTWAKVRDRQRPAGPPLLLMNTHFDHRGAEARLESAKLLREQATRIGEGSAVIITGDFNAEENSPPYAAMFQSPSERQITLRDAYRVRHPRREGPEGTFTGFDKDQTDGSRIDWIAVSELWEVLDSSIDRTEQDGRLPSDHFPVNGLFRLK